jgi:aminoglycoside phosphotransferase (APT) family kinase protein
MHKHISPIPRRRFDWLPLHVSAPRRDRCRLGIDTPSQRHVLGLTLVRKSSHGASNRKGSAGKERGGRWPLRQRPSAQMPNKYPNDCRGFFELLRVREFVL